VELQFFLPPQESPLMTYLHELRQALGVYLPLGGRMADTLPQVPGLYAFVSPHAPPLLRAAPRVAWESSPWRRVMRARPARPPGPALDPARLGEGAVVFLHRREDPDHALTSYRLGDALRRRVQWVAGELYPPGWWGWRDRRFLGVAGGFAFFRVPLPLRQRATLVAFDADDPAWRRLRAAPPPVAARPATVRLRAISELARHLERRAGPGDPFVTVFGPADDDRVRLLPFLLRTGNLFVLTGEARRAAQDELAREPARPIGRVGDVALLEARLYDWRTLLAVVPESSGPPPFVPAR
jgi:hypothetical protein